MERSNIGTCERGNSGCNILGEKKSQLQLICGDGGFVGDLTEKVAEVSFVAGLKVEGGEVGESMEEASERNVCWITGESE
jgi:hypothetical protein